MRVVSADSETMRPPQIAPIRSSLVTTRAAVADQIFEDVKNLGLQRDRRSVTAQFPPVGVEDKLVK